jgi:hypothetical protein
MTEILLLVFLLIMLPVIFVSARRTDRRLKEWAVPRAAEIAKWQGWVSPHRLMTQAHLKKSDAQSVLLDACRQGLLHQAVNGRYYLKGTAPPAISPRRASGAAE